MFAVMRGLFSIWPIQVLIPVFMRLITKMNPLDHLIMDNNIFSNNNNSCIMEDNIVFLTNDYTIYLGRNAKENDGLIRAADPKDIWLHLDDCSSPHAILSNNKGSWKSKKEKYKAIKKAAFYVRSKSKLKKSKTPVPVVYLPVSKLTLTDTPGEVLLPELHGVVTI